VTGLGLFLFPLSAKAQLQGESFRGLKVRQERIYKDGILISRPLSTDRKIVDLIALYRLQNLDDYARWLTKHISYKSDGPTDRWAEPEEMLQKLMPVFIRFLGSSPGVVLFGDFAKKLMLT